MKRENLNFKIENNILKSKEISYEIGYTSLGKFALDKLETSPDFVGQIDAVTGEKQTYATMRERSVRCALWMRSQGVRPGDVVTTCAHNQLDIVMPYFGAMYIGAAFNPLDVAMNTKEILHLINITRPKIAFVSEESAIAVTEAAKQAKLDLKVIVFGRMAGFLEFESIIAEAGVNEVKSFETTSIKNSDEIALVMCSSGTTGLPKGIALSHEAILKQILRPKKFNMTGNNYLIFTPFSWISGTINVLWNLELKIARIILPPFEEYSACQMMEKFKATVIFLCISMVNRLLHCDALKQYDLSSLRLISYGGSPLAPASRQALAKSIPNTIIVSGYGMTEACGLLTLQTPSSKPDSVGSLIENVQLKVADANTGEILGPNERGELLLKTDGMMKFYYGDPQTTAATLDKEGWLHSGDLGYYDEDGEIFVDGRLKDLIKYRGYHVSPLEIENVISSVPGVKEVAVVGVAHPVDDEHPAAFVVKAAHTYDNDNEKEVTERTLMDLVAAELSDNKRLRGGVFFVDHLPKTSSGKTIRETLRALAIEST